MSWFNPLTERQIAKARAKGELSGLTGEVAPLPDRPGDAFISPGDAVGSRIMAEAGVLPEEITLKKAAAGLRQTLASLTDADARKTLMAERADLEMRQAIAEAARRRVLKT